MKPRIIYVSKFGRHGIFDAYDGKPDDVKFLEPFIDIVAYDAKLKELEELKQVVSDYEKGTRSMAADAWDAKVKECEKLKRDLLNARRIKKAVSEKARARDDGDMAFLVVSRERDQLRACLKDVVDSADSIQCECTIAERESGHRTDCQMPTFSDAIEKAKPFLEGK